MSRPNILFLDDDKNRTKKFVSRFPWTKTAVSAVDIIALIRMEKKPIDDLFLDHDLGGEVFVDSSREDCGMGVVRWLVANKGETVEIKNITVHSHNEPAAKEMVNKLKDAGYSARYIPFAQLINYLSSQEIVV